MKSIPKKDRIYYFRYWDDALDNYVHLESPRTDKGQRELANTLFNRSCEYGWFPKDKTEMLSNKILMKGIHA